MKSVQSVLLLLMLAGLVKFAGAQSFSKTPDGVTITIPNPVPGGAKAVRLKMLSERIIRVTASPSGRFINEKSLAVIPQTSKGMFTVSKQGDAVVLKAADMNAIVSLVTGGVRFTDKNGQAIINEVKSCDPLFVPFTVDKENLYHINQSFETHNNEAFYGLGQHQEGVMNYRNGQVNLLQQNTDVAVPFMVSSSNYGILWDNYSISSFGDCRDPAPLEAAGLVDANGNPGALTATYAYKKRGRNDSVFTIRREADINYPYLSEQKDFPAGFNLGRGVVTWEGSIVPAATGKHTIHLYEGGYLKLWIDGKLLYDGWRQSWNPAFARLQVPMEKGQKHPVKIWWDPDGGESYLSLKWIGPVPGAEKDQFAFKSEAGNQLDYYFIKGNNIDEVIGGYRKLTGKATLLPKWAFGFWQSRERYKTQQEIINTVAEFRKRHIGLDNIVLDWSYWKEDQWGSHEFDTTRFPDAEAMIKTLHDKYHAHFMISVWPKFYTNNANYAAMDARGYLYKRNVELGRRDWIGKGYTSTFYDAYNPGARKLFWKQLDEKLFKKGVDAWWMDASEPDIHSNVNIQDRKDFMNPTALGSSTKYFNGFALQNAKGIYEGQRQTEPNKRVFILTRSGFAGLQRYAAATWSGDIGSRWRDMKNQVSAGVNFCMSGLPYWTMDIGGFAVERRYENPDEADKAEWQELQTRWYQFGAFVPIFRVHGQYPFREVYNIAPEDHPAYKSILFYNRLRYRLMPYIYSLAGMAYQQDYTLMRGLAMDFGGDENVRNINDQFMFGPALLVNPVSEYKARSRELFLPTGSGWYNAYDGNFREGGQTITADAPYERMPLFIKAGSIIPMGPSIEYTMQKPADTLTVFLYAGKNGSFSLYEDEGTNYNYEKGMYSVIPLSWNDAAKTLAVGTRKGSFPGMLTNRVIRIVVVSKDKPKALDADSPADKTIRYHGSLVSVKIEHE